MRIKAGDYSYINVSRPVHREYKSRWEIFAWRLKMRLQANSLRLTANSLQLTADSKEAKSNFKMQSARR